MGFELASLSSVFQLRQDRQTNPIEIRNDFMVPDPQHAKALIYKIFLPLAVCRAFSVLRTIDLNDQPRFETHKVKDIAIDRNLSLEFESLKLTATQRLPEHILSLGGITAHCSGKLPMSIRNVAMQEFFSFALSLSLKASSQIDFKHYENYPPTAIATPKWSMRQFSDPNAIAEYRSQL